MTATWDLLLINTAGVTVAYYFEINLQSQKPIARIRLKCAVCIWGGTHIVQVFSKQTQVRNAEKNIDCIFGNVCSLRMKLYFGSGIEAQIIVWHFAA